MRFRAAALREIGDTYPCVVRAAAQPYRRGEANADTDQVVVVTMFDTGIGQNNQTTTR